MDFQSQLRELANKQKKTDIPPEYVQKEVDFYETAILKDIREAVEQGKYSSKAGKKYCEFENYFHMAGLHPGFDSREYGFLRITLEANHNLTFSLSPAGKLTFQALAKRLSTHGINIEKPFLGVYTAKTTSLLGGKPKSWQYNTYSLPFTLSPRAHDALKEKWIYDNTYDRVAIPTEESILKNGTKTDSGKPYIDINGVYDAYIMYKCSIIF